MQPTSSSIATRITGLRFRRLAIASAVAAALIATAGISLSLPSTAATAPIMGEAQGGFADLVERVKPAVVNISTRTRLASDSRFKFAPGSPMERQFREFFGQQFRAEPEREAQGMGSGFVVDPSGYIVTNNHVIDGANTVTVTLHDATQLKAKVVGSDPKTDLALLKVTSDKELTAVSFGDSSRARVGDWVVAVGNPFGLGGSVTAGIISARGRDIQSGPFDDFLQVDAPINRGNSGGPLFDTSGHVIGVNTAIFSPSGGNVGIGFAIPSAIASHVIESLKADGAVARGWMGVSIQALSEELAEGFKLDKPHGALISSVSENSPAARAGFVPGDVILSFNGQSIDTVRELPRVVAESKAGDRVPVVIWRDGKKKTMTLTVGRMPGEEPVAQATPEEDGAEDAKLGVVLSDLDDARRLELGLSEGDSGVLVAQVRPDSPAARRGLRAGDVIVRVGNGAVGTVADAARAVRQAHDNNEKQVLLLVRRDGGERFVAVPFERG